MVPYLYDKISEKDYESVLKKISEPRKDKDMIGVNPMEKYNQEKGIFECLNREEVIKILRDLQEMPEREPTKPVPKKIEGIIHVDKRDLYYPSKGEEK